MSKFAASYNSIAERIEINQTTPPGTADEACVIKVESRDSTNVRTRVCTNSSFVTVQVLPGFVYDVSRELRTDDGTERDSLEVEASVPAPTPEVAETPKKAKKK